MLKHRCADRRTGLICILLAGLLASCSTGSPELPDLAPSPQEVLQASLPVPSELPRATSAGEGVSLPGSAFSNALPHNAVSASGGNAEFTPSAGEPARLSDMAYAIFELDLSGITPALPISLDWQTAPDPADMYFALAHWSSNRWNFSNTTNVSSLNPAGLPSYVDTDGRCLIGIFLKGSSQAVLSGISVAESGGGGISQGNWWSFGQNARGQRRSPFTGPASDNVRWKFLTGHGIVSSAVFDSEGTIYTASYDGNLYAINPDGTKKWELDIYSLNDGEDGIQATPTIGPDGTIYIGSFDKLFYAVDNTGSIKWTFDGATELYVASAAVGSDGTVYITCFDGNLYAINPVDGTEIDHFSTGVPLTGSPSIGSDGTIYFGCEPVQGTDPSFFAVNPDMSEKWHYLQGLAVLSTPAIADDGTIYFGCEDGRLYAMNPDGTEKWNFSGTDGPISSSPAIGSDGTIHFGTNWETEDDFGGGFYAIKPDGTLDWSYDIGDWVTGSAAVDSAGNTYFGSYDGFVYSLDSTGNLRWSLETDPDPTDGFEVPGSASIGPDGTMYIGTVGHNLYAFGTAL